MINLNENNIGNFMKDKASIPKALLFSDKKNPPLLYNALGN